jgi:hypothetical protein
MYIYDCFVFISGICFTFLFNIYQLMLNFAFKVKELAAYNQWQKSWWGGGTSAPPHPPTFVENDEFSEILTYKRAKNSLFECKWGGGGGLSEI